MLPDAKKTRFIYRTPLILTSDPQHKLRIFREEIMGGKWLFPLETCDLLCWRQISILIYTLFIPYCILRIGTLRPKAQYGTTVCTVACSAAYFVFPYFRISVFPYFRISVSIVSFSNLYSNFFEIILPNEIPSHHSSRSAWLAHSANREKQVIAWRQLPPLTLSAWSLPFSDR